MDQERPGSEIAPPEETPSSRKVHPMRRALKIGCLATLLMVCGCFGTFAVLLQSGPLTIGLPFVGALRVGSDDFVLSNYSFSDGTTYFLDLDGNGQRNILEFRHTKEDNRFEIVLHHADGKSQGDKRLLTLDLP